ncbi:cache domain-containing protein [Cyanobium sp. BA20m-14]|uniref:cache domain-containing protein n=1 Tax=Cyanobium sp. BA20m-14 TaxID=2823703 RepID=UPI0020CC3FED|nr:hypothetical protein [Cyanobium sp. BA20m-14]MCP9913424.1 cache domain-containing protein [Cyanobium sp. BA20m-14]
MIPSDGELRRELLRQIRQTVPCTPDQLANLTQLLDLAPQAPKLVQASEPAVPGPQSNLQQANRPRLRDPATWPVGIKLGGLMVLFSLLPALLVGFVGASMAEREAEVSGQRQLAGLASSVARGLNHEIQAYVELIRFVSKDPGVISLSASPPEQRAERKQRVLDLLDRLQRSHPHVVFTYLLDREGNCIAASDRKLIGHNYSFRTYFQRGLRQ